MNDSRTDSKAAPNSKGHRRRRWAILVAVSAVVLSAFYFAPRRDPRFVGQWVTTSRSGIVGRYELFPDGSGAVHPPNATIPFRLRWWNARGQLVMHYTGETALQTAFELMHEFACTLRGVRSRGQIDRLQIRTFTGDRITFEDDWVWERVSSSN